MERLAGLKNIVSFKYGSPSHLEAMVVALERFSDRFAFIDNSLAYTAVLVTCMAGRDSSRARRHGGPSSSSSSSG